MNNFPGYPWELFTPVLPYFPPQWCQFPPFPPVSYFDYDRTSAPAPSDFEEPEVEVVARNSQAISEREQIQSGRGQWSLEEDQMICALYEKLGTQWAKIAKVLKQQ
jgi:hypothetical protein